MPAKTKTSVKQEALSFEQGMEQLEEIVEEMEGGALSLEELIARYEKGTQVLKLCQQKLDSAQGRVEKIMEKEGGEIELEDFSAGA